MRYFLIFLPVALFAQTPAPPAAARPATPRSAAAAAPEPVTDNDKAVYAIGLSIYKSLAQFNLSPAEVALVKQAITDSEANQPAEDLNVWGPKIQALGEARAAQVAQREKAASGAYLSKAAAAPGAVKLDSGVIYHEDRAGMGASPAASDTVKVNYRGTLTNGTEFDSSYARNEPAQFPLNGVIKCWTEGVQKMKVGGKATLVCPSEVAYGDQGRPPQIPGGATLVFEIELLEIGGGK
jgi:FKBP-type peptidyl-prolyl cis-trans isomerase FkpA